MSRAAEPRHRGRRGSDRPVHPLYVRITHWINALAVLIMIGSGWQIYNASPLFAFTFPSGITLGGWLAGGLLWHFAAMWLLIANGLVYVTLGLATGRFRRKLLPIRPAEVVRDLGAALTGRLRHDDLARYNAVQKLLYAGILLTGARHRRLGLRHLEARAAEGAGGPVRRLRRRAARAFLRHGRPSSCSWCCTSSWRLLVPKSLRAMIRGR